MQFMNMTQKFHNLVGPIFRKKRMAWFKSKMNICGQHVILDIGGWPYTWKDWEDRNPITSLNTFQIAGGKTGAGVDIVTAVGDGCSLPYAEQAFDICFSNSVIEHVGTWDRQKAFAREIRRVGRGVWVQTPAFCFPVEPHLLAPFIHWFPRSLQRRLIRNGTLWGLTKRPSPSQVEAFLNEVRLLNYREMQELFPDCTILKERFLFITKSYIAFKPVP